MAFRFLEDIALADIAFEAEAPTLEELFVEAAKALSESMVDTRSIQAALTSEITLSSPSLDRLLFDWLAELIYLKDTESMFFKSFEVAIEEKGYPHSHYELRATARGESINPEKHILRNDVKAVTMHQFTLEEKPGKFTARIVLDI